MAHTLNITQWFELSSLLLSSGIHETTSQSRMPTSRTLCADAKYRQNLIASYKFELPHVYRDPKPEEIKPFSS